MQNYQQAWTHAERAVYPPHISLKTVKFDIIKFINTHPEENQACTYGFCIQYKWILITQVKIFLSLMKSFMYSNFK